MSITKQIRCDICHRVEQEPIPANGFPGWGGISGVILNEVPNPSLCPEHLKVVMDYIDRLTGEH